MIHLPIQYLAILEFINFLTYAFFISYFQYQVQTTIKQPAPANNQMDYLVAGIFDHPDVSMRFLQKKYNRGITIVNNSNFGWSPERIAQAIVNDIEQHNYHATVYAISIGDQVARFIEEACYLRNIPEDQIRIISLNPCPNCHMLKPHWRIIAKVCTAIIAAFTYLLGWISVIPIIPSFEHKFCSLAFISDQLLSLAAIHPPKYGCSYPNTIGIVLSDNDQFLDNSQVINYFHYQTKVETIPTAHAYTVHAPHLYQAAINKILDQT